MQVTKDAIARRLRKARRPHAYDDGFLESENVAEVVGEVAEQWQFRRSRVGDDATSCWTAQQIDDGSRTVGALSRGRCTNVSCPSGHVPSIPVAVIVSDTRGWSPLRMIDNRQSHYKKKKKKKKKQKKKKKFKKKKKKNNFRYGALSIEPLTDLNTIVKSGKPRSGGGRRAAEHGTQPALAAINGWRKQLVAELFERHSHKGRQRPTIGESFFCRTDGSLHAEAPRIGRNSGVALRGEGEPFGSGGRWRVSRVHSCLPASIET